MPESGGTTLMEAPPLNAASAVAGSLYVHFPWCVRKCPYCDFNSHTRREPIPEGRYLQALLADLDRELELAGTGPFDTVFLGGGTPSLFSPEAIGQLLETLGRRSALAPGCEVTLEANPGTVERGRFSEYADAGVNRVSLGAQSFDDASLQRIGRIHRAIDTVKAVEELRATRIGELNLDLMYGLPGQTVAGAITDVARALALQPEHLSHYQLTLEPDTAFFYRPPPLPDEDLSSRMGQACAERLAAVGLTRYEVSAWAHRGHECRHNLNYWRFGDYVGIGAGAHGKRTHGGAIVRRVKLKAPASYMSALLAGRWPTNPRLVGPAEAVFEFMLNSLRLTAGFTRTAFERRTGLELSVVEPTLIRARQRGFVQRVADGWRATDRGLAFLNDLLIMFLPDQRPGRPVVAASKRIGLG